MGGNDDDDVIIIYTRDCVMLPTSTTAPLTTVLLHLIISTHSSNCPIPLVYPSSLTSIYPAHATSLYTTAFHVFNPHSYIDIAFQGRISRVQPSPALPSMSPALPSMFYLAVDIIMVRLLSCYVIKI